MKDCPFCGIAAGTIPATIVYSDEDVVAFRDIDPKAPTHVLLIPREHISSAAELTPADDPLWGRLLHVAQEIAADEGINETGYRLVVNVGPDAGQSVEHMHMHLLGGRPMAWPPG